MPITDSKQDWLLLSGSENETHTCVIFKRPFLTCDYDTDLPITNDVTKLIWAYDIEDPVGSSAIISKHSFHRRGHKSVHLLSHKFEDNSVKEEMMRTWDITSSNLVLPNNTDTTYWCKIVTAPFVHKAHVIRIEPIISPARNAPFVHHMVLYRCLHPDPDQMKQYIDHPGTNCFDFANMPFDFIHCQSIYMVWATGGDALNLPDNVGIPIAEDHETSYFLFEVGKSFYYFLFLLIKLHSNRFTTTILIYRRIFVTLPVFAYFTRVICVSLTQTQAQLAQSLTIV